ncbi:MAG: hypothetical protein HFG37_08445 [Eubacterium sp.]|nr:hypothetical protein [Eubacterium sp.]MCI9412173.1 hypothetical protein [Eubacterium sp.]
MELKDFAALIAAGAQGQLGDRYEISDTVTIKNNTTEYTGIIFQKKTENVAPTIYIEDLYERYKVQEVTIQDAIKEVISRYEKSIKGMQRINGLSVDYASCQDRIIYRLVSKERNLFLLKDMPYIPFLDMAITFHLVVSIDDSCMQSLKITRELQQRWGVSVEQLLKLAKKNTPELLPARVCELSQLMKCYINTREFKLEQEEDLTNEEKIDMIVVSNELGINGAAVMLYDGVMEQIANEYDSDLYLLPSSIHEIIVVPAGEEDLHETFSSMVNNINQRYVDEDEVLSDRVYIYRQEEKKFE